MQRAPLIAAVVTGLLFLALGGSASARASKTIAVADDFFDPTFLKVKEDTRVDFNWTGTNEHNIEKRSGPGPFFRSDNFEGPGIHYKRKFQKPGNYVIGCVLHEDMLMDLKVTKRR